MIYTHPIAPNTKAAISRFNSCAQTQPSGLCSPKSLDGGGVGASQPPSQSPSPPSPRNRIQPVRLPLIAKSVIPVRLDPSPASEVGIPSRHGSLQTGRYVLASATRCDGGITGQKTNPSLPSMMRRCAIWSRMRENPSPRTAGVTRNTLLHTHPRGPQTCCEHVIRV